jgi:hypothetical protein
VYAWHLSQRENHFANAAIVIVPTLPASEKSDHDRVARMRGREVAEPLAVGQRSGESETGGDPHSLDDAIEAGEDADLIDI